MVWTTGLGAWVGVGEAEGVLAGVVDIVGDTVVDTILVADVLSAVAGDMTILVTVLPSEETVPVNITKKDCTDKQILKKDDYLKMTKNIQATLEDINSLASVLIMLLGLFML